MVRPAGELDDLLKANNKGWSFLLFNELSVRIVSKLIVSRGILVR